MFRVIILFLTVILMFSCSHRMDEEASRYVSSMTVDEKVGQLMMFAIPGKKLNRYNKKIIKSYKPGGIIFFGYNISGEKDLLDFTESLQEYAYSNYSVPLFITTDQEGGRVRRIREGVESFPGNLASGISAEYDIVNEMARIQGLQLRRLGINMNLAPVLDVNNNPENPVINTRSFGSNPEVVSKMGEKYIEGLAKGKCISVAKHFPGHGDTSSDSHYELPVIEHDMKHLENNELIPFRIAIDKGVECIMTAHILYPMIEKEGISATMSYFFLTELLRKKFKFNGIIMTDDLEMNAVSMNMKLGEAAVKSFKAGTDIILVSTYGENIRSIHTSLLRAVKSGDISMERLDASVKRIIEMKLRYNIAKLNEKTGKLELSKFIPDEDDEKIISRAETVNEKVSSSALYLKGNIKSISGDIHRNRIYISRNNAFRDTVKLNEGDSFVWNYSSLLKAMGKMKSLNTEKQVVFHFYRLNRGIVNRVSSLCKKRGFSLVLVFSGNPFIFSGIDRNIPVLFTFSPTDMSMKAAASVFNGTVVPKTDINCDLGFYKEGM